MIYKLLKQQKAKHGLTEDLVQKIDVFFAAGKLTEEQYRDLLDLN